MATRSTGTPNTNSEGAITGRQRTKKGPQHNDYMQGNNSSAGQLTEDNIHRIAQGVIQHLAKANVTNNSNGNDQGASGTSTTTSATSTMPTSVNPTHAEYNPPSEVEAEVPPARKLRRS